MEITQIKETALYMEDLDAAKEFYHGKLGFPIINEVPKNHLFLRAGNSVLLCFNPDVSKIKEQPPPHFAIGNQHIAFEVAPEDYEKWKNKILRSGITIIQEQSWKNNLHSFYFRDPANHVLEIIPKGIWE